MTELPTTSAGFEHAARSRGRLSSAGSELSSPGPVTSRSSWSWVIRHALCRYVSVDPDQWFPASAEAERVRQQAAAAIAICHGCPAAARCLAMSLRYWDIGQHGVWGGLVSANRGRLRNRILSNGRTPASPT